MLATVSEVDSYGSLRHMPLFSAGRTHAVKGATEPVWRETLILYVRDSEVQSLTVHVEHAGRETQEANILLGYAKIDDIQALCDGKVHDLHLNLEG